MKKKQTNKTTTTTFIITITTALLILVALLIFDLYLHNFHTVIPNQVYRSRQLSQAQFDHIIKQYNIKTIINLRGAHPYDNWYKGEINASKKNHITHFDFPLSSKALPDHNTLTKLISVIATAPHPILIHCQSGVDRTGLGSIIALILNNASMEKIQNQVSLNYFVLSHQSAGRQLLRHYSRWLKKQRLKTSREHFNQFMVQFQAKKKMQNYPSK